MHSISLLSIAAFAVLHAAAAADYGNNNNNNHAPVTASPASHGSVYDAHAGESPEHHAAHAWDEYIAAGPGKVHGHDYDTKPQHNPPPHIAREAKDDQPDWKSYWSAFHAATASHKASLTTHLPTWTAARAKEPKHTGGWHNSPGGGFFDHIYPRAADQSDEEETGSHPWRGWCDDADVECDASITNAALSKRFAEASAEANPRSWRYMLAHGLVPFCGMRGMVCRRGLDSASLAARAADGEDICAIDGVECSDEVAAALASSLGLLGKRNAEAEAAPEAAKKGYQPLWHGYLPFCGTRGIKCRRGVTDEMLAARAVGAVPGIPGSPGPSWNQGSYAGPHHKVGGEKEEKGGFWSGFWPGGRG